MKENTKNARINVRSITFTAVMAALVFVFTYTFKIPFVNGYTHIGDSMIFLAIVFLGYKKAPLAAGIGAGLADLIGGYSAWVAPTFIIKFFMALICALIMEKVIKNNRIVMKTYTQEIDTPRCKLIRLRVGPFNKAEDADAAAKKIKALGLPAAILTL